MTCSVPQSGAEGGQVYTKPASVVTSNPFKPRPPMSYENDTDNPYQPPAPSDEPLAKKDADGPKAKPHPFHWWIPWLGYGYFPAFYVPVIALIAQDKGADAWMIGSCSTLALFFLLPVYGLVILGLTVQRTLRKTNSVGLTLFQILSMVLPILWLILWLNVPFPSPV